MEVTFSETALWRCLRNEEYKRYMLERCEAVVNQAQETAPKTRRPTYAPSIRSTWALQPTDFGPDVYTGYIIASRHEMVIEYGWHDVAGRWHPGKFNLTKALKTAGKRGW